MGHPHNTFPYLPILMLNFCLIWKMPSSGMWRRVGLVWTDDSEECIASIFSVEKFTGEEPSGDGILHNHCRKNPQILHSVLFVFQVVALPHKNSVYISCLSSTLTAFRAHRNCLDSTVLITPRDIRVHSSRSFSLLFAKCEYLPKLFSGIYFKFIFHSKQNTLVSFICERIRITRASVGFVLTE
jgi:hypothetical protein